MRATLLAMLDCLLEFPLKQLDLLSTGYVAQDSSPSSMEHTSVNSDRLLHDYVYKAAIILQEIKLGEAEIVLTGGTESMSQAPYAVRNTRWGSPLGVDLKVHASCSSRVIESVVVAVVLCCVCYKCC